MNCLVTRLKGSVNDSNLPKLGELRIAVSVSENIPASSRKFNLIYTSIKDRKLEIIGNGYFTDEAGSANLGKLKTISDDTKQTIYLSLGEYTLSIEDKYSLKTLEFLSYNGVSAGIEIKSLNIEELNYSFITSGSIGFAYQNNVFGNIDNILQKRMTSISICNTNIEGDFAKIANPGVLLSASNLNTKYTKMYGDITKLLQGVTIAELTDSFKGVGALVGDLSKINNVISFISFRETNTSFTWLGTRPSEAKIVALEGSPNFGTYLDAMLINQANCTAIDSGASGTYKYKIEATGVRTSASDSAISTLQSKGYTVVVPSVESISAIATMSFNNFNFAIAYKDKELIVEPVNLSVQDIYPAPDVTVKEFATEAEAWEFISLQGLVREESK